MEGQDTEADKARLQGLAVPRPRVDQTGDSPTSSAPGSAVTSPEPKLVAAAASNPSPQGDQAASDVSAREDHQSAAVVNGMSTLGLQDSPDINLPRTPTSNPSTLRDGVSPPSISDDERSAESGGTSPAICFCPAPNLMETLQAMGFTDVQAKAGLYNTGNASAEAAVDWILSHGEEDCILPDEIFASNMKMILVVNAELKMGLGKMAAQVSHASLGLYRQMLGNQDQAMQLGAWGEQGETMVVVRGETAAHLLELERQALDEGLRAYTIQDAGRTQIAAGSLTVLAVFGPEEIVDRITGKLKLL